MVEGFACLQCVQTACHAARETKRRRTNRSHFSIPQKYACRRPVHPPCVRSPLHAVAAVPRPACPICPTTICYIRIRTCQTLAHIRFFCYRPTLVSPPHVPSSPITNPPICRAAITTLYVPVLIVLAQYFVSTHPSPTHPHPTLFVPHREPHTATVPADAF